MPKATEVPLPSKARVLDSDELAQRLAAIVESSDDAIIGKDLNGIITSWNTGAQRIFGYAAEEVIGKPVSVLMPTERVDEELDILARIRSGERVDHYETVRRRKDGTLLDISLTVSPVRNARGVVVGASKIARDISERKRAEQTLRKTQERLELALRGGELASWDWNIETGEMTTNPRCSEMRGYQPGEIRHHADWYVANVHPDDSSAFQHVLDECLEGVRPEFELEYRAATKGGEWIWLLSRGKIFERDRWGRPIRMVGTSLDITTRKRAEEGLRISEVTAKRATQARDEMLRVVAHDLRNPLMTIAALAAVLQKNGPEQEIGDEIEQATRRMSRLIRDLVDATLLEAGTFAIKQERTPAYDVLYQVVDSQTPLASSASLTLSLDAGPDVPDVWADRDRLLQVFENLVGNAIKFTKPGGGVVVSARAGAGEVLFSVSDTGCGIEDDQLPRVFDRFWQAPEAKREGVGLGLPIVKGIVEAHGGRVWVQSSAGRGTTFCFTIPVVPQAA